MKSEYLSVRMVADWLGVTPKRVYVMIQQGMLDAIRLGPRQIRILRPSVQALLDKCTRLSAETRGLDAAERREMEARAFGSQW